jgi:hypothetical protein
MEYVADHKLHPFSDAVSLHVPLCHGQRRWGDINAIDDSVGQVDSQGDGDATTAGADIHDVRRLASQRYVYQRLCLWSGDQHLGRDLEL